MNEILKMIQEERVLIYVVTIVIMLDVITGVIKAVIEHDLKSCKFKEGILKKLYDYILCLIGVCLDYVLKVDYACAMCIYIINISSLKTSIIYCHLHAFSLISTMWCWASDMVSI